MVAGLGAVSKHEQDSPYELCVGGVERLRQSVGGGIPFGDAALYKGEYLHRHAALHIHEELYAVVDVYSLSVETVVVALVILSDVGTYGVAAHLFLEELGGRDMVGKHHRLLKVAAFDFQQRLVHPFVPPEHPSREHLLG